jgi:hypothetical protein
MVLVPRLSIGNTVVSRDFLVQAFSFPQAHLAATFVTHFHRRSLGMESHLPASKCHLWKEDYKQITKNFACRQKRFPAGTEAAGSQDLLGPILAGSRAVQVTKEPPYPFTLC